MANDPTKHLTIEVHLDEAGGLPTASLLSIARWLDTVAAQVSKAEFQNFLSALDLNETEKLEAMGKFSRRRKFDMSPAEIVDIRRGSWIVVATIASPFLVWGWKKYLEPVVEEAWQDSATREKLRRFLRDELFGGAKSLVEREAVAMGNTEPIQVVDVQESRIEIENPEIKVKVTKRRIIGIRGPDPREIQEFYRRMGGA